MHEERRLLKNTGLIAIGNIGVKITSFLLLPFYTSVLTTSEYGLYDYVMALSAFLLPVVTMCMQEAMFRFIIDADDANSEFDEIISNVLAVILCGVCFLIIIMLIIEKTTGIDNLEYISIYVLASSLYSFSNNLLRGLGKIKEFAFISSGKNISQLIFNVIAVAILKKGVQGLLFAMCISECIAFLITGNITKINKYIKIKYISINKIRMLLCYSLPLIPNTLCGQIINISDRLIISGVMGSSANGIYSISYKFPNIVETVYHYFYLAWSESASRILKNDKKEAAEYYQNFHNMISDIVFSTIVLLVALMPVMFRIFIRGEYSKGFIFIPLLLFAMYFDSMGKFYSGIFTALKKTKLIAISTIAAALVNLVINIIFIRKIGLFAAAGSTLIANIVLVFIRKYFVNKKIHIKISARKLFLEILVTLIIIALYSYDDVFKIIISILIGISYFIFANQKIISKLVSYIKYKLKKGKS